MSRQTPLVCVVLWGFLMLFAAEARSSDPDVRQPIPAVADKALPEPPRQKEAWKPPATKVPDAFVKAAALLFEQGMADPRGCEYRAVKLTSGGSAHGWVLPAKDSEKQRFAIRWNGLVYPVASVDDKVDLKKDALKPDKKQAPSENEDTSWSLWGRRDIFTALLLRLGEGDLASELWAVNHPPPTAGKEGPAQKEPDPYLSLASLWGWLQFDRASDAYEKGEDAIALRDFRKAMAFIKVAEPEAKKRGFEPRWEGDCFLDEYMATLPNLVADLERRAKEGKREAIVCFGPGRDPDQQKRIAALILCLDEIKAPTWGINQAIIPSFDRDPIVMALIREGEPAVEPLLKCYAADNRLTRTIVESGGFCNCKGVSEPAYVALAAILDFSPRSEEEKEDRKKVAARFREHQAKGRTQAERWFRVLADDKAKPEEWLDAAEKLLSPILAVAPDTTIWSIQSTSPSSVAKRLGESLRRKKDPSVTELLMKRIKQADGTIITEPWGATRVPAAGLALVLVEWEPKAALEPLAAQTKRLRDADKWADYVQVIEARVKLGDRKALDEYVALIGTAHPKMLNGVQAATLFDPMIDHPDHPGMAKAAEELFANEKSPWLPLLQKGSNELGALHVVDLIPSRLLRQPAFRKAALKELADKTKAGNATLTLSGFVGIDSPFGSFSTWGRWMTPKEEIEQKCRRCDFCAWKLGQELQGAPRCELYWTEAERDKAVTACIAFLRRQQYELEWRSQALRLDKPATAAQVEQGQAVFALADEEKVRIVSGLKLPIEAQWITLKDHPCRDGWNRSDKNALVYAQRGKVVQAEEVFKEGKWRRYYGFVGVNHVARAAAEEIEFSPDEPLENEVRDWVRVGLGLHVRLNVPPIKIESFDNYPARLPADAALTFSLLVRNSAGLDQPTPDAAKSVKLRILYSPEIVSRQGALVPKAMRDLEWLELYTPNLISTPGAAFVSKAIRDPGWTELPSKSGAKFTAEKGKSLAATEEMELATFDLRDWFDVSKPGFYRLQLLPAAAEPNATQEIGEVRFSLAAPQSKPTPNPKP